ncbi:MAG TPA: gamma-glutamyl-gamma-aminobutyrate hydrolase family protein [Candidatus Limnocylindrales bacterium]|nr:gamma-glutamyl-gamma-aminobutyrate hydrolase family protein [Candidatus Limnocylindrales bacterium]
MPDEQPLVVITASDPATQPDASIALRKYQLYADAVSRHGGRPLPLAANAAAAERETAYATMDGLLLSGGADIHPARYGRPIDGSRDIEPDRDELEARAWAAAEARDLPVFGICRGLQAINVFAGGTLLQDVADHPGPAFGSGPPARMHPIRIEPATRFGRALADRPATLEVNSYHHQAVTAADLAPSLVASAWASSPAGEIVEALEAPGERFVVGVQCHPERTEFTPAEFEGLWAAFLAACRARRAAERGV